MTVNLSIALARRTSSLFLSKLGTLATDCVARSIARGVYFADSLNSFKCYKEAYSKQ